MGAPTSVILAKENGTHTTIPNINKSPNNRILLMTKGKQT
jgi:hypothetical protein